jgi:predicted enzyme related to lactoylglutathione lyase
VEAPKKFSPVNSFVFPKKTFREKISFSVGEIGELELKVKNLKAALEFYQDKLGISVLDADSKSAMCDCNGMRFMLTKSNEHGSRAVLYLKVDDIQRTFDILKARGVEFYESPKPVVNIPGYMLWVAFFHDVDNNLLSLMSENWILETANAI